LAKDWFARLTQPQRDAWNLYARRIHRRWRPGRRTLTGQQAYLKLNSVLGRIGRPPLLWPPPQPAPFRPNPVQAARLRWDAGRLRLELLVAPRPKGDFLVFASAPCSPGWSRMRRPVYLGLLRTPADGVSDITALYLARFPAPAPNQQVFIQTRQHRHGWEGPSATHSALVPPTPAPQPPQCYIETSRILDKSSCARAKAYPGATPSILHPPSSILFGWASAALPSRPSSPLPVHSPPSPRPYTLCTREIPILPAPTAPSRVLPLCRSRFTFHVSRFTPHVSLALTAPWRATTPCRFPKPSRYFPPARAPPPRWRPFVSCEIHRGPCMFAARRCEVL
ncbi:MAG: hypothetical protein ABSD29_15685, partial [Verrucomicrobiota bacterium]